MSVIVCGDSTTVLRGLPSEQFNCCVTSPPYWGLRDYGVSGQIGLERTPEEYVARLVAVFLEVRRVLRADGTLWLNLGDSYAGGGCGTRDPVAWPKQSRNDHMVTHGKNGSGLSAKQLIGIPWRVAFALQADGWYLRSDIIWAKPNPMPESVTDRPTKAHEYLFLLAKSEKYYYNAEAIKEPFQTDPKENYPARARITGRGDQDAAAARGNDRGKSGGFPPASHKGSSFNHGKTGVHQLGRSSEKIREDSPSGRNKRSVWTIATQPYPEAHFATFPEDLVRPCILAGCPQGGSVLDPFAGSGTTLAVAKALGCAGVGIELNQEYCQLAEKRLAQDVLDFQEMDA